MFLTAIIVYLIVLLTIGIYKTRSVKTQEDFMVAGRKTPVYKLVGTLLATWIGSGSIIAGAGLAYRVGFSELWLSAGAWVAIVIVYFLAGRVRKISQYTMPDILEQRYNKWARILGTITIVIAYVTIASYQFKGGAFVLNLVAGIPVEQGIIITAVFVVLFTALAGLVSVITMDIINGTLMLLGIVLAVPIVLNDVGGWTSVREALPPDRFAIFGQKDFIWAMGVFFPTFFLLLGESSMYQKFFSAKDAKSARQAVIFWVIGTIIIETSITALAVFASAKFKLQESEKVILHLATHGSEIGLPQIIGIMLIVAAMAIIISTANSFLLTPSTNLARDIYQRFINPNATHKQIITLQRILILKISNSPTNGFDSLHDDWSRHNTGTSRGFLMEKSHNSRRRCKHSNWNGNHFDHNTYKYVQRRTVIRSRLYCSTCCCRLNTRANHRKFINPTDLMLFLDFDFVRQFKFTFTCLFYNFN